MVPVSIVSSSTDVSDVLCHFVRQTSSKDFGDDSKYISLFMSHHFQDCEVVLLAAVYSTLCLKNDPT